MLLYGLDVYCLFEARAQEFDVVYTSIAAPVFLRRGQGHFAAIPIYRLWVERGQVYEKTKSSQEQDDT